MIGRRPDAPGPCRPASAAYLMLGLLPAWVLCTPPPPHGIELAVEGPDRRPTVWRLPENVAIRAARVLKRDRRIRNIRAAYFTAQERGG